MNIVCVRRAVFASIKPSFDNHQRLFLFVQVGTPLCTRRNGNIVGIGRITSINHNDNPVDFATKGQAVSIKVQNGLKYIRRVKFVFGLLERHV